jgi:hypothetical protein
MVSALQVSNVVGPMVQAGALAVNGNHRERVGRGAGPVMALDATVRRPARERGR